MPTDARLRAIDEADWERFPGPKYYSPDEARIALRRLAAAGTEEEAQEAYHAVLFGVGNNHQGTFYPAVIAAIPLLVQMSVSGSPWTRWGALEVLTDLATSFEAEPGYETFDGRRINPVEILATTMADGGLVAANVAQDAAPESLLRHLEAITEQRPA